MRREQTSSESTSVFDILRARMGMPIESVLALPHESDSWNRQIFSALKRHSPRLKNNYLVACATLYRQNNKGFIFRQN